MKTNQSTTKLNNGVEIPYLGLGTWRASGKECTDAVEFALTHGYAMIDTAQAYRNERQVGDGWKASGLKRKDVFITTKISNLNQGYQSSLRSFEQSLKDLQTDDVDLLLIHWPNINDFQRTLETWQALIALQEKGQCRSIGVSNFTIPILKIFLKEFDVAPAVNQVEFHTFLYQKDLLEFCRNHHIQLEAYSPIARAKFFENDTLQKIASKHSKTPAQVMLAWCVSHDVVVIPKSVHEGRLVENANIFFELDDDDMLALDSLEPQTRLIGISHDVPTW